MSTDPWSLAKSNLINKIIWRLKAQEDLLERMVKATPRDDLRAALEATRSAIHVVEGSRW